MSRPCALLLSDPALGLWMAHRRILRALQAAHPAPVSTSALIEAVYPDNEPDSARRCLRVYMTQLRKRGWTITGQNRVGYRLSEADFDRLTLPVTRNRGIAR